MHYMIQEVDRLNQSHISREKTADKIMTGTDVQGKVYVQWCSAYAIFHLYYKVINTRLTEFLSFSCLF